MVFILGEIFIWSHLVCFGLTYVNCFNNVNKRHRTIIKTFLLEPGITIRNLFFTILRCGDHSPLIKSLNKTPSTFKCDGKDDHVVYDVTKWGPSDMSLTSRRTNWGRPLVKYRSSYLQLSGTLRYNQKHCVIIKISIFTV